MSSPQIPEYDQSLPYAVIGSITGKLVARFARRVDADYFTRSGLVRVVDTTPKPRVPDDARIITWTRGEFRYYAERINAVLWGSDLINERLLEHLPGVTPDTEFTVLVERVDDD